MGEVPVVLTIAGFDPSSGAGATADLKAIAAHGMYGVACVTALTVQSTQGVLRSELVPVELVKQTLDWLAADMEFAAIKIGMLASSGIVEAVTDFLASTGNRRPLVVLDPVLRSSSGSDLLDAEGVIRLRNQLLKQVDWITPNVDELGRLLDRPTPGRADIPQAAKELQADGNGALNLVVTGGHLEPPDDYLLTANESGIWIDGERVEASSTHGTGCAFSTALACRLAWGDGPEDAARGAKEYVVQGLRSAYPVGKGRGPLHHLWPLSAATRR